MKEVRETLIDEDSNQRRNLEEFNTHAKIEYDLENQLGITMLRELSLLYGRIELFDGADRK